MQMIGVKRSTSSRVNLKLMTLKAVAYDCLWLFCFVAFWLICDHALAVERTLQFGEPEQPNLSLRSIESGHQIESPLAVNTDVYIDIVGPIVRTRVVQQFMNPSQYWAEGLYRYPLPENAAVDQLSMYIGERIIEGQVHEKHKAKNIYTQAKRDGKRTVMLEAPKDNLFTTQVANIPPGESIKIEFVYQEVLALRDHGYALRFPIVATPRYYPRRADAGMQQTHPDAKLSYRDANTPNGNPVYFHIILDTGMAIQTMHSTSHKLKREQVGPTRYKIEAGSGQESNRDFVLSWTYKAQENAQTRLFTEYSNDRYYNMLMLLPPAPDTQMNYRARELTLVLDVSGSMSGESIRQAKAAVNEALDQLQIEDQFNLIFFNDRSWSVFPQAKPANANNVARAKRALRNQSASGGTRMSEAFQLALPLPQTQEWLRQVVFITDGAVGNTDQLLAQIKRALGTSRLFIVGIGAAPNSYFMRRASEVGRGTYAYIGQLTQVEQKMVSLFEKINKPALTEIELLLDVSVDALLPTKIPDIYLNEMALLLFQSQSAPTELLIKGLQGDAPVYFQQALETEADVSGISVEWARRKIKDLQAQILETSTDRKAALIDELIAIALKHNQISRYTSLVAVDVTPIRAGATLAFEQIRSNLPKGWQLKQQGTQTLALAQTSNGLAWMTHVGLLWLLVALALGVFSCNARRHLRSRNGA